MKSIYIKTYNLEQDKKVDFYIPIFLSVNKLVNFMEKPQINLESLNKFLNIKSSEVAINDSKNL